MKSKLISFLGRVVYNFDERYILTANFRRDGSSKFGPNNRWGNFPSIAFAWRASNENFLKQVKWLDNLKLRVSYGFTGNQENLPPYAYQLLYGPVRSIFIQWTVFAELCSNTGKQSRFKMGGSEIVQYWS